MIQKTTMNVSTLYPIPRTGRIHDAKDAADPPVGEADELAVEFAVSPEGMSDGPLDGSPTKNVFPPMGEPSPIELPNCVRLKLLRVLGTGILWTDKLLG